MTSITWRLRPGEAPAKMTIEAGAPIEGGDAVRLDLDDGGGRLPRLTMLMTLAAVRQAILRGPWPPAAAGVPVNTMLPSILTQPLAMGVMIDLDPGLWDGEYDWLEVRLQQTADLGAPGDIYLDWTALPAGAVSGALGEDCHIAARAIRGGAPVASVINPQDFGPWVAAPANPYAMRLGLLSTQGYLEAETAEVADVFYMISADNSAGGDYAANVKAGYPNVTAIAPDASDYGQIGGFGGVYTNLNSSPFDTFRRLRGSVAFSSNLNSANYLALAVPDGWYKLRIVLGSLGTSGGSAVLLRNGNPVTGLGSTIFDGGEGTSKGNSNLVVPTGTPAASEWEEMSFVAAEAEMLADLALSDNYLLIEVSGGKGLSIGRSPEAIATCTVHGLDLLPASAPEA